MRMIRKKPTGIVLLLFVSLPLFADHEIKGGLTMYADTSEYWEEVFLIKAKLGAEFDLPNRAEAEVSLYFDEFEVNPDELTITLKIGEKLRIRSGYKENFLTLDEFHSSFDRPVNETGLITEYYDYLGYVARYLGVEVFDKNDWYAKGGVSNVYPYEPQFDGTFFFHPFGKESFYGITGLYLGNYRTVAADEGDYPHHFAFTLHASDTPEPWIYAAEVAFGSNYASPIGYMTLPTDDSDKSYFLGGDLLVGREIPLNEMEWIPGMRYSLLFPDAAYKEYYIQRAVLANQLYLSKGTKIFLDLFLEHEKLYLDISEEDYDLTLALYAGLQVTTN
ncbi:MAG: hypothetical protein PQJ60_03490 [Spirochaetales bacterium]|nr:hypothetical protein [Spirochaetales bacterium]